MTTSDTTHPYERLTPEVVIDAVESRGLLSDARILGLNSYENRVYQVGIESATPVIAKFYRPERWTDAQIQEEHDFVWELADTDIPVVPPIKTDTQKTLTEFQHFKFAIFPRQGGYAPEFDNLDNLLILGRYIGRIHAVGRKTIFAHRPTVDIQSYGIDSVNFLLESPKQLDETGFLPAELFDAYESLTRDLLTRLKDRFSEINYKSIRLHGDCHAGNVLWRDDCPHFVDFDDARNGPAIQDLWMLLSGDRAQQTAQINEVLEGYRQFCEFNLAELNLIEPLRTLRIMHYAAWLARRWSDPAFPHNFPWFNTTRYWSEHILELREQLAALNEPPLTVF